MGLWGYNVYETWGGSVVNGGNGINNDGSHVIPCLSLLPPLVVRLLPIRDGKERSSADGAWWWREVAMATRCERLVAGNGPRLSASGEGETR